MKKLIFDKHKKIEPKLLKRIRKIVNKHNPIGIYYEDNPDEYDPEIGDIYFYFKKCKNFREFNKGVYLIFVKWFSKFTAGPKKKYFQLSKDLYKLIKDYHKNDKEKP